MLSDTWSFFEDRSFSSRSKTMPDLITDAMWVSSKKTSTSMSQMSTLTSSGFPMAHIRSNLRYQWGSNPYGG